MHISFLKLGSRPHQLFLAPFVTGASVVGFIQKTAKQCDEFTPQSLVWHLSACPCLSRFTCSCLEILAKTRGDDCISTSSVSLTQSKMWHPDKSPLVLKWFCRDYNCSVTCERSYRNTQTAALVVRNAKLFSLRMFRRPFRAARLNQMIIEGWAGVNSSWLTGIISSFHTLP